MGVNSFVRAGAHAQTVLSVKCIRSLDAYTKGEETVSFKRANNPVSCIVSEYIKVALTHEYRGAFATCRSICILAP